VGSVVVVVAVLGGSAAGGGGGAFDDEEDEEEEDEEDDDDDDSEIRTPLDIKKRFRRLLMSAALALTDATAAFSPTGALDLTASRHALSSAATRFAFKISVFSAASSSISSSSSEVTISSSDL